MARAETVSVIIPLYNAAPFLAQTVQSILAQSYPDWRLYIIDDHSTDGSAGIAKKFAADQPDKISYFRPERAAGKPSVGKNIGIQRSQGALIAFMDHDDWWTSEHLALLVEKMGSDPKIGLVGSNGYIYDQATDRSVGTYRPVDAYYDQPALRRLALAGTLFLTSSCTLVRRQIMNELGLIDETLVAADDKELTIRVIVSKFIVEAVATPTVYHRLLPTSISNRPDGIVGASRDTDIVYERYAASPNLTTEEKAAFAAERALFRKRLANYLVSVGRYREAKAIYRELIEGGQADRTTRLFARLSAILPGLARSLISRKRRQRAGKA